MDPGFVQLIGSRDTLSPHPSELESLDGLDGDDEQNEEVVPGDEAATDLLGETDSRTLNFVGATIRDASYPGDGGRELMDRAAWAEKTASADAALLCAARSAAKCIFKRPGGGCWPSMAH